MLELLKTITLFQDFPDEQLEYILATGLKRSMPKGAFVFREGDPAESMFVMIDGRARCFTSDNQGKEFVFKLVEPGDAIGEISLIDNEPRGWSCLCEEDSTFLVFGKREFCEAMEREPHVKDLVIRNLAAMVRHLSSTMKNLALLDVYGRVRALFESMLVQEDGVDIVSQPLTQQAIADRVGSSREMIARILKELVFGGYIRLENKRIIVLQKLPERF
ncbi:Crp/Fnr family transcriptional regulator [Chitinibacter sp. S2-10]|uniref:Crp/Fnr family transcriptional regulator n=1 Tax=Chitinibacter sp. S2-10 TaxID=3373597 RepID=UPI003977B0D0